LDTDIERKVIECLESLGLVREKDFLIKPYIETTKTYRFPDILLPKYRLVIECDGEYWHDETYDKERDKELTELGFKILHLKETVILEYPNLKEYLQKKIFQDEWRVPVLYVVMKKKEG
jgi:G:T-mismatch repair DNA endonuclease (very short patch repair protein)